MNQTELISIASNATAALALMISIGSLRYSRIQARAAQASNGIALRTERRAIFNRVQCLVQECEEASNRGARLPTNLEERVSDLATDFELVFGPKLSAKILEVASLTRTVEQAYDYRNHGVDNAPEKYEEAVADESVLEHKLLSKLRSLVIKMKPEIRSNVA